MNAFDIAIGAAETVRTNAVEQLELDIAAITLNTAINTFNAAKQDGQLTVDAVALQNLIDDANDLKAGIAISTNGNDVGQNAYWVTQSEMNALNNAITAAENAITNNSGLSTAYLALTTAMAVFENAKKPGTLVPTHNQNRPQFFTLDQCSRRR